MYFPILDFGKKAAQSEFTLRIKMKFTVAVQNQKIAWPTQRNFNKNIWLEKTKELAEDQRDYDLSEVGIWTADTLGDIQEIVKDSESWRLPFKYFAQAVLAMSNRDYKLG